MLFSRLLRLALGELGDSPFTKFSSVFSLAFVSATALVLFGVSAGLEDIASQRLLGDLPNYIRVEAKQFSLGPISMNNALSEDTLLQLESLKGVKKVFRIARLERPASLTAAYAGQHFVSDILVDAIDREFIERFADSSVYESADNHSEHQLNNGEPTNYYETNCLLASSVVDALLSGVSIHTDLPGLTPQALIGRHFNLNIGSSTFSSDSQKKVHLRCCIVGISPLVGVSGPNIPYDLAQKLSSEPLKCRAALLHVEDGEEVSSILQSLERMRLKAPGLELAKQASQAFIWIRLGIAIFCLLLGSCAGFTIFSNLNLEIKTHSRKLALYRALGAAPIDIFNIYLIRIFTSSLIGSSLGLVLGCLGGSLVNKFSASYSIFSGEEIFKLSSAGCVLVLLFTVLSALLFCLFPIYRSCRLDFSEAD
ncbi:MAG: FtsX-like permease family protein [Candidatus Bruticola sp.]